MEAAAGSPIVRIEERLENQNARISSNHDSIRELRTEQRETDKVLGGLIIELRETRVDIRQTQKLLIWVLATSGTATVSLITLLIVAFVTKGNL